MFVGIFCVFDVLKSITLMFSYLLFSPVKTAVGLIAIAVSGYVFGTTIGSKSCPLLGGPALILVIVRAKLSFGAGVTAVPPYLSFTGLS